MNAITLSISTMAFGVMIGITGTHYQQTNRLVEQGLPTQVSPAIAPLESAPDYQNSPVGQPFTLASSDVLAPQKPAMPLMVDKSKYRDDALLEILRLIRNENASIGKQLAETNRDVSELTFQVDTHSDSFKPLRTDSPRPSTLDTTPASMDGGVGVLPPKQ